MKYILVSGPAAQIYISAPHSHFSDDPRLPDSSYFVREDVYTLGQTTSYEDFTDITSVLYPDDEPDGQH